VLELELDICIVQRLRAAGPAKAVVGVVAEGGSAMLSREALARSSIGPDEARSLASGANDVIVAIRRRYLTVRPALDVCGKTAILVDEGAATSTTLVAAIAGLRRRGARDIVVAVPVATQAALAAIKSRASEIICLATLPRLRRIGAWYHDHRQISDGHVMKILGGGSQPS
jgi:putative phosphoribosyl transferase